MDDDSTSVFWLIAWAVGPLLLFLALLFGRLSNLRRRRKRAEEAHVSEADVAPDRRSPDYDDPRQE